MSRRLLVLIVIILGLCWFASASLGLVGGPSFEGRLDLKAPSLDQIRQRFTARLPASQMRLASGGEAGCKLSSTALTVPEFVPCVYAIQPEAGKTRRLSLSLGGDGQSVRLVLVQPETLSVDQILKAGDSIDLDFFKNDQNQGSELTIKECVVARFEYEENGDRLHGCVLEIKN
jgi:hypothetical protein